MTDKKINYLHNTDPLMTLKSCFCLTTPRQRILITLRNSQQLCNAQYLDGDGDGDASQESRRSLILGEDIEVR